MVYAKFHINFIYKITNLCKNNKKTLHKSYEIFKALI